MSRIRKAAAVAAMVGGLVFAGAGAASADAGAIGSANTPPVCCPGTNIQIPVSVDANVCGNSIGLISLLNPAYGNNCSNDSGPRGGSDSTHQSSQDQGADRWIHSDHHDGWVGDHHAWDHGQDPDCC
ncbi:chaplin [Streptacidiphilus sp. 4-A2]|nr:chaplin [Streptacidiphilus sp. 4-A2]